MRRRQDQPAQPEVESPPPLSSPRPPQPALDGEAGRPELGNPVEGAGELEEGAAPPPSPPPGAGVLAEPADSAIQRLEGHLGESQDRFLRLAAEYDNFRKRVARERVELGDRAQAALVLRLLDVLDDLDRLAAQDFTAPPSPQAADALHQALLLVDKKLRKELHAAGLTRIDPTGEPFDPALHEAVAVAPPPAPEHDHRVSAVLQAGYQFKGNLVRPARVQVYARAAAEPAEASGSGGEGA